MLCAALAMSFPAQCATTVDNAALTDEQDGTNWLSYGRSFSESRFSPLTQINELTVEAPTERRALAGF